MTRRPPLHHVTSSYRGRAIPDSLVLRIAAREQRRIYRRFETAFPPRAAWRVLDLGENGEPFAGYGCFFLEAYPYAEQVTAAGLETGGAFRERYPRTPWVQVSRGAQLPFPDDAFDLVFCSAVIEHVGSRAEQARFLREVLRVAPRAFVTTPNRWYPVELHTVLPFVHWLPAPLHRSVLRRLGMTFFAEEENLNLLDRRALTSLVPKTHRKRIETHRFLGLPSNLLLVAER